MNLIFCVYNITPPLSTLGRSGVEQINFPFSPQHSVNQYLQNMLALLLFSPSPPFFTFLTIKSVSNNMSAPPHRHTHRNTLCTVFLLFWQQTRLHVDVDGGSHNHSFIISHTDGQLQDCKHTSGLCLRVELLYLGRKPANTEACVSRGVKVGLTSVF